MQQIKNLTSAAKNKPARCLWQVCLQRQNRHKIDVNKNQNLQSYFALLKVLRAPIFSLLSSREKNLFLDINR